MNNSNNSYLWLKSIIFLLCCAVCMIFLGSFMQTGESFDCLEWERKCILSDGVEADIDPLDENISENNVYVLYTTLKNLPDNCELSFTQGANQIAISVDGTEIYSYSTTNIEAPNSTVAVSLPQEYDGKTLSLRYVSLSEGSNWLPIFILQNPFMTEAETFGYANHTGIPAGFFAMTFLVLTALIFLNKKIDWRLMPLSVAFFVLMIKNITDGQGYYFLPECLQKVIVNEIVFYLPPLLLILHIVLNFKRINKIVFIKVTSISAGAILIAYLLSLSVNGHLASNLSGAVNSLFRGDPTAFVYWFTVWAVFICLACTVYGAVNEVAAAAAQRKALLVRESAAREAYLALDESSRLGAELRHEIKNRIAAMSAMAHTGETEKLTAYIDELNSEAMQFSGESYTDHFLINAIIQKYSFLAGKAGIRFEPVISVPEKINADDADLSTYLMNMLDNAYEATSAIPREKEPFIKVVIQITNGFLTISCTNSCADFLEADKDGNFPTTKEDGSSHGFGLKQMKTIAEKYGSVPVISVKEKTFTVKTAFQLNLN